MIYFTQFLLLTSLNDFTNIYDIELTYMKIVLKWHFNPMSMDQWQLKVPIHIFKWLILVYKIALLKLVNILGFLKEHLWRDWHISHNSKDVGHTCKYKNINFLSVW